MLPADMVGGVSPTRQANLEASGEALSKFVSRVDAVLRNLEESAGNPTKVGAQTIKLSSLSAGSESVFPEAHDLYWQYHGVHTELTSLSKVLHLQIEAIGIAVRGAEHGFDKLEEDQRRRFWEIQAHIRDIQAKPGSNDAKGGATLS
ncbi:hypothetical protein GCM10014715_76290 [Streptomyces spiralis]|uniref:Uncharacterized protein n=1 Tax=Streptomyces spiralis TaxID=66376 RepID=A0A919AIQ1_9ACTN|nr:hypothetical protein [Streptomyces spiralis]GHF09164.1 hypothetical protein GCM10014715_76290 [Streptomyces spiralis]